MFRRLFFAAQGITGKRGIFRPATIYLSKKPKIFEIVKSKRAAANFQKSRTQHASAIISKNSQIKGIKMFAGLIITMSMIQHHFCLIIMIEKLINY